MPTEDMEILEEMYSDPDFLAYLEELEEEKMQEMMKDFEPLYQA